MPRVRAFAVSFGATLIVGASSVGAAPLGLFDDAGLAAGGGLLTRVHAWHRDCQWGSNRFHRHMPDIGQVECRREPNVEPTPRAREPAPRIPEPVPRYREADPRYGPPPPRYAEPVPRYREPPVIYAEPAPRYRSRRLRGCRLLYHNVREFEHRMRLDGRVSNDEARIARNMRRAVARQCGRRGY